VTAPRIISAAEAQAMLEAGRLEQGPRLDLLLSAPDLAASVVALHAEVDRLRAILPPERERGQGIVGEGSWAVFAERVVAQRDAEREKHARQIDHNESFYAVRIQAISDLAKKHGIWNEVAAILANGKGSPEDPPTYDHMLAREKARADKAEANYRWMVERAADQRLDGYRELGARAANAENEADRLRTRLRDVAQFLIEHTGSDGPMDAEDAARKVVERIETLQRIADEKSHEAGLYARRMSQAQIAMREALAKARTEPDHDYVETTLDRDDNPTPPRCAYCGRGEAFCKGRKP